MSGQKIVYPIRVAPPASTLQVSDLFAQWLRDGGGELMSPVSTGFPLLDRCLGGGFYPEDLVLLGGMQGVGKTSLGIQIAVHMAGRGHPVCYVCYEHSVLSLFLRILCLSSGMRWEDLAACIRRAGRIDDLINDTPVRGAWEYMGRFWENLSLMEGGADLSVDVLSTVMEDIVQRGGRRRTPVLIVDYLQIVPVRPDFHGRVLVGEGRLQIVMQHLKAIATHSRGIVIAVSAAKADALQRREVHIEDLLGPELVQYHPDTVMVINPRGGDSTGMNLVLSVEKNRHGPLGEIAMRINDHFGIEEIGEISLEDSSVMNRMRRAR